MGAVFNVSQTTSEIINGLAPLRIQNSVNRVKHYLKLLMFSTQDVVGFLTGYKVEVVASLAKKDLTPDMTR